MTDSRSTPAAPVVAIHAGAGGRSPARPEDEAEIRAVLERALESARSTLDRSGHAVDAVQAAVVVMEDYEGFNAGRGSTLCSDGSVEMSAALMRSDRGAGAVAGLWHTVHPIRAAAAVLESPQVLMVGSRADALAERAGVPQRPRDHFVTERQTARLRAMDGASDHATVGAVCLDSHGALAAGTSTGGVRGQPPGRVGDSPSIGAGTWADRRVAVSCTGDGEAFLRAGTARYIAALLEHGVPLAEAADRALAEVEALGGSGGLTAVDAGGAVAMPFTTRIMPRGLWRGGQAPIVWAT